jgi:hypothetical protein
MGRNLRADHVLASLNLESRSVNTLLKQGRNIRQMDCGPVEKTAFAGQSHSSFRLLRRPYPRNPSAGRSIRLPSGTIAPDIRLVRIAVTRATRTGPKAGCEILPNLRVFAGHEISYPPSLARASVNLGIQQALRERSQTLLVYR